MLRPFRLKLHTVHGGGQCVVAWAVRRVQDDHFVGVRVMADGSARVFVEGRKRTECVRVAAELDISLIRILRI